MDAKEEKHLTALKSELETKHELVFEALIADLFSRLLGDVRVSTSKAGSQEGADMGTAGLGGRRLRVECKRYKEESRLAPRELAGEVVQAIQKDPLLEAWILASTKQVKENELALAMAQASDLGLPIIVIDWATPPSGVGLNRLAALCATWPEVVKTHLGKAAFNAAKALAPLAGDTVGLLQRELEPWHLGFYSLREASLARVRSAWTDKAESKAILQQDAAGGRPDVHLIHRAQPHKELSDWWDNETEARKPAALLGPEGVGKTWVALDWLNARSDSLPITFLVGSSKFVGGSFLSEGGFKGLITQLLKDTTKSRMPDNYWDARVARVLSRPAEEGPAFLIFVDGLNQHPGVDWRLLAYALQAPELAGKVRLVISCRKHFYDTSLRGFSGLEFRPTPIPLGPYTDPEFEEILRLHGIPRAELSPKLDSLARTPRLFQLVVHFKDSKALLSDASVPRLLFEYGRDTLKTRVTSDFTEDAWTSWIVQRARDIYQELEANRRVPPPATQDQVSNALAYPGLSPQDVSRRLSDVIDGGFYSAKESLLGTTYSLNERHTVLGLGLALISKLLEQESKDWEHAKLALETWLEPIAAIDQVTDVIHASLAVLSASTTYDGKPATDALLTAWMTAQNPTADFSKDAFFFGDAFPLSMLAVVEHSSRSDTAAFRYSCQSLRQLPYTRKAEWDAIRFRMLAWCSPIVIPKQEKIEDSNHYAKYNHEKLQRRVGQYALGERTVLGEKLSFVKELPFDTASAVPVILEGHALEQFAPVIRRAVVRDVVQVDFRTDVWKGIQRLAVYNSRDPGVTKNFFRSLAQDLLAVQPEAAVHPLLKNKAAASLLKAMHDPELDTLANELPTDLGENWNYKDEYLTSPATSFFALERRHVDTVLADQTVPEERRLKRIEKLMADPSIVLPPDLQAALARKASVQPVKKLRAIGMSTREDHDFEELLLMTSRFSPNALGEVWRRLLHDMGDRTGDAKYWASIACREAFLISTSNERPGLKKLRESTKLPTHEDVANGFSLMLEIAHLTLPEQLSYLLEVEDLRFLEELIATIQAASAHELEAFQESNPDRAEQANRLVMAVMIAQQTANADVLASRLIHYLSSTVAEERTLAFRALSLCAPEVCGRTLLSMQWTAQSEEGYLAEYGSTAIIAASGHMEFSDVLACIAPWKYLDCAVARGERPQEVELASNMMVAMLMASGRTDVVDFGGELTVKVQERQQPPSISVREATDNRADGLNAFMRRANETSEEQFERSCRLTEKAHNSIKQTRVGGNRLYLYWLSKGALERAFLAAPALWRTALDGIDEESTSFLSRIHGAQGAMLSLCEVLLEHSPQDGSRLWRSLRKNLRLRVMGAADVPELIHMVFRAPLNDAVLKLREEVTQLEHCNTDAHIMDIVLAAQLHGQLTWLQSLVTSDAASEQIWRQRRAIFVEALMQSDGICNLKWQEGLVEDSWQEIRAQSQAWANRGILAKHWWTRFVQGSTAEEALAAWHVFLSCADRRAWLWVSSTLPQGDPCTLAGLDRMRRLHLAVNRHELTRALKKREAENPSFADHFLREDPPQKWMTLDGATY